MTTDHHVNKEAEYEELGFSFNSRRRNRPLTVDVHSWSPELEEVLQRDGITSVAIYYWTDHPRHPGLGFLAKYAEQLRFLSVDNTVKDHSVVSTLVNLERLSIRGPVDDIDFSGLSRLQECELADAGSIANIAACLALKELMIEKAKVEDLAMFAPLQQLVKLTLESTPLRSLRHVEHLSALQELHLVNCRRLETLDGIEHTQIKELWLDVLTRLRSIAPLTQLSTLEKLYLGSCKQIEDLERLGEIISLKRLWIMTGRDIPSLAFLRNLHNLRQFGCQGTKIVDGNLEILLQLPSLEAVTVYRPMRHYSHTEERLNEILQKRHQPAE